MKIVKYNSLRPNRWWRLLATAALALPALGAVADSYYGYAPIDPDPATLTAQGSGNNGYAEAAIELDPVSNPLGAMLKGKKIKGVRCYMRSDYPQKSKRTSGITVRYGSLDATAEKNYANLMQGWNDVIFDQPIEIADEPLYIGPMVYETSGNPYPLVSAPGGAFPGGYSISLKKSEWQQLGERGNLLCHLIIDEDPSEMPLAAQAAPSNLPLVVAPESTFGCSLTIHNFSGHSVENAEISITTDGGSSVYIDNIILDPPLAAFDTRTVDAILYTGKEEDPMMGYTIAVTALDGVPADAAPATPYTLHVTHDAFLRIPLVEEFTSQMCTNCPFMAYYLDMALEDLDAPYVYISRHTGFVDDVFTHPFDKELEYLFGTPATYNPAVMYDRTVRGESDPCPVYGAKLSSPAPYTEALMDVSSRPALAKIIVDSQVAGDKVTCRVHGRVADGISLDNLHLNASFIENGLTIDKWPQLGIADAPADAPDDLAEKFHHNGIVRVAFNKEALGDALQVDPDTREFDVTFDAADINPMWNLDNCEAVAFISRVDKDNLKNNYVLNAGGTRWNNLVGGTDGVRDLIVSGTDARAYIGADRKVRVEGDYISYNIYTVYGQNVADGAQLQRGVYIVDIVTDKGHKAQKIRF